MNFLTKRNDAQPYPDGIRLKLKNTNQIGIIERECKCGDWLHYEVRFNDANKSASVFQHIEIKQLFEIVK
jgi:hypothetical protein